MQYNTYASVQPERQKYSGTVYFKSVWGRYVRTELRNHCDLCFGISVTLHQAETKVVFSSQMTQRVFVRSTAHR